MDIGIDLGTTFSVIAVDGRVELAPEYPPGIYLERCDVTIIPSPLGEPTFPSVLIDDPSAPSAFLFGSEAVQRADEGEAPVVFSKRKIGTDEVIPLGTRGVRAKDFAREFLRHMRLCAERALGRPVRRAVVTHPAYFDRSAVEETRQAARDAGFDMDRPDQMLMEPVAAALAYTRTDRRDPLRVLTYDLGGGTFDVAYLERRGGVLDVRAFDGDHLLGGYNLDRELVTWVRARLAANGRPTVYREDDPADRGRLARLLRLAEKVKIDLAAARADDVPVPFRGRDVAHDAKGKPVMIDEKITRAEFVTLIGPYLERTIACCRRAMEKAGVVPAELDEILLVGGSTRGPWVAEAVRRALPGVACELFEPDLCVAAGAAIHARMVLPDIVDKGSWRVELDVPETVVLTEIVVSGRVTDAGGRAAREPASATLRVGPRAPLGPVPVDGEGRFLFEGVELDEDAPTDMSLRVVSTRGGGVVLEHGFRVRYQPQTGDASGFSTVLPRPLYVETVDGLVALAEAGVALPARIERSFERLNELPNISLRLFQEQEPAGEIRIEGIPREGGTGSFVDLAVEVTAANEVRGTASIRTRDGRVVHRTPVRVCFVAPEIPSADELRAQFAVLKAECETLLEDTDLDEEHRRDVRERARPLLTEARRLLEQQPLERQEVLVALKALRGVLTPPPDEMSPPRAEFLRDISSCRQMLDALRGARATGQGGSPAPGGEAARVARLSRVLDALETRGLEAHARRDRRTWAAAIDGVHRTRADLHTGVDRGESPPTPVLKIFATFQVMAQVETLRENERRLASRGERADWVAEIRRIAQGFASVIQEVQAIDDDLDPDQARARVQLIFAKSLKPLQDARDRLGAVIGKA